LQGADHRRGCAEFADDRLPVPIIDLTLPRLRSRYPGLFMASWGGCEPTDWLTKIGIFAGPDPFALDAIGHPLVTLLRPIVEITAPVVTCSQPFLVQPPYDLQADCSCLVGCLGCEPLACSLGYLP